MSNTIKPIIFDLNKEKILSSIMILDRFFIKGLTDEKCKFKMQIQVDEKENKYMYQTSLLV